MPTETMDTFLDALAKAHEKVLTTFIAVLNFTEKRVAPRVEARVHSSVEHEIDFGSPVGKQTYLVSPDPEVAAQQIATIMAVSPQSIEEAAQEDFFEELEQEDSTCIMPNLREIRELHTDHPVFGFLIAYHDVSCDPCGVNSVDDYEEREQRGQEFIAGISETEQELILAWARNVADVIFERPGRWESLVEAARKEIIPDASEVFEPDKLYKPQDVMFAMYGPILSALHHWTPCPLAAGLSDDMLLWLLSHTDFLRDLMCHRRGCDAMQRRLQKIERRMLEQLPADARTIYEGTAALLSDGNASLF